MLKIALTGSHGTGKTTLANLLVQRLSEEGLTAAAVQEIPRLICELAGDPEYFRRAYNTPLRQLLLLIGQAVHERKLEFEVDVLVTDRSLLDHWIYTVNLFEEKLIAERVLEVTDGLVALHLSTYSAIFYVPIEFPPVDDGTREADEGFQHEIDHDLRAWLDRREINIIAVHGSPEERVETVLRQIEGLVHNE